MKELQHLSMFLAADNEHGFIQCVIKPQYRDDFQALGFVDHVSRLKKTENKVKSNDGNKKGRLGERGLSANKN